MSLPPRTTVLSGMAVETIAVPCVSFFLPILTRVVRVLVHKYPPSLTDEDENGNTPLHLAALNGRTEVVDFLIDEGAEVEARWAGSWVW